MEPKTNRVKRRAEEEIENDESTSKKSQVINMAVGAKIIAQGNSKVLINRINVNQHIHQLQPTPEHPPYGIEFQVADPVASFCGRVEPLQHVKKAFNQPKNKKPYNLVAVCGYGGIGKTEFARKFIQLNRADFQNVIWIHAEFEGTMNDSFSKLQDKLRHKGYHCSNHQEVYNYLNSDESIFVFDNAENMQSINSFLPKKNNSCFFLITSQYKMWNPYESIALDKLDLISATTVIKVVLETHEIEINESQLQSLVNKFERIPLVLQIGAGFLCQEVLELKSIGTEYNLDNIIQGLNTESEFVTEEFPAFSQDSYAKSVFQALSRTLQKIWIKQDKASQLARNMLGISAYLNADYINKEMLRTLITIENENLFNKSMAILVQFSLFKFTYFISIHRSVQECVRYYCREKLNSNEYYFQSLHVLLHDGYKNNHEVVLYHGKSYFETFSTFYDANKCRTLNRNLGDYISYQLLQLVLLKMNSIINPDFLCEAVASERDDIKQLLLDHGVDFNVLDGQGFSTLYYACLPKHDDYYHYLNKNLYINWYRIQALIVSGADVNSINLEGNTVIHNLCYFGQTCTKKDKYVCAMCALMIRVGGDPKIKNNAGQTPADLAREYGLTRTLQLLDTAISGYTYILHIAAECRQFKFLGRLIIGVCDRNECDDSGRTILHVLAGLAQLNAKDEAKLLYNIAELLKKYKVDVSIQSNVGETAADVARRCGRDKMADIFSAEVEPSCVILRKAVIFSKIEQFSFISSNNREHMDQQDDTGCTLLHTLCGLDALGDTELDLDIAKLAVHLVIECAANVRIMNNAGDTAADVARCHGRLLLADFLDLVVDDDSRFLWDADADLIHIAVKYKQFGLIKYTWWRYCYQKSESHTNGFPVDAGYRILHKLCGSEDLIATDAELIRVFNDLDLELLTEYAVDEFHAAVGIAKQHGRNELVAYLRKISSCDINKRDDSGCTLLHRFSSANILLDNIIILIIYPTRYKKDEENLFNKVVNLVVYCGADVSVVNNAGETAAAVARRRGQQKLADFLHAWAPTARTVHQIDVHRNKLQHFPFVSSNNVQDVDYQDDTGCTLLHALCSLDTHGDTELELDLIKLATHLVIKCGADVRIMNNAGATAADVARRLGRLLLADFLHPSMDPTALNLISISAKYKQFGIIKYVWWRYLYTTSHREMYANENQPGCRVLRTLCKLEDLTVTDDEVIKLISYLYLDLKQVAKYTNDFYNNAVALAKNHQRAELAVWLEKDSR